MKKRLARQFYTQPTLKIAKEILGNFLIHKIGNKKLVGRIVETEAYIGPDDLASHARGGKKTERNKAEFLKGGHIYIYLVYGMYWQFNISTFKEGHPECILIRALEPVEGIEEMYKNRYSRICANLGTNTTNNYYSRIRTNLPRISQITNITNNKCDIGDISAKFVQIRDLANGPGKLCQAMGFDGSCYGLDMATSKKIWIEKSAKIVKPSQIVSSPRIGIDYAGFVWSQKPWRFYMRNCEFVS